MKKIFCSILLVSMVFVLSSCTNQAPLSDTSARTNAEGTASYTNNYLRGLGYQIKSDNNSESYAYVKASKLETEQMSAEDFLEFMGTTVSECRKNELARFTIDFGDGTGITIPACNAQSGIYGKIDKNGNVSGENFSINGAINLEELLK